MFNSKSIFLGLALGFALYSCEQDNFAPAADNDPAAEFAASDDLLAIEQEENDYLKLDASIAIDEDALLTKLGYGEYLAEDDSKSVNRRPQIYTLSNSPAGNEVILFQSNEDGTITEAGRFATGGTGTGGGLGNQGAIAVNLRARQLWAVNPGDNSLSLFFIFPDGTLELLDTAPTNGDTPVSVTVFENVAYVVHSGSDDIAGFRQSLFQGDIRPIAGSVQQLSSTGTAPAQISFKRNGRVLIVTEKATNAITTFQVDGLGRSSNRRTFTSAGETPFGFDLANRARIVVSEAARGVEGAGTVSTYRVRNNGRVSLVDGPVTLNETAACWVALNRRNGQVFVTNTGSDSASSLNLDLESGALTLNAAVTATGDAPLDADLNRDGSYLYVLTSGDDALQTFRVAADGSLQLIDTDGGLPDGATGVFVRR